MKTIKSQKRKYFLFGILTATIIVVLISAMVSFSNSQRAPLNTHDLSELSWLAGQWKGNFDDGNFIEEWKWTENALKGRGRFIVKGDTLFSEKLSLRNIENNSVYISIADDNAPTLFTLTNQDKNTWVFENMEHDFPKSIAYKLINIDSLHITVEGKILGIITISDEYSLKRVKK